MELLNIFSRTLYNEKGKPGLSDIWYVIGIYDRYLIGFVPPHRFGIPEVYENDLSSLYWIPEVKCDHC